MKKTSLLAVLILGMYQYSAAQEKISFNVKVGLSMSNYLLKAENRSGVQGSNLTSFFAGVSASLPLGETVSFEPGLTVIGKGTREKESGSLTQGGVTTTRISDSKLAPLYLEVPLNLLRILKVGSGQLFFGAGPYIGFGIGGKYKIDYSEKTTSGSNVSEMGVKEEGKIIFGGTEAQDMKGIDFGVNGLAGYRLANGFGVQVGYGLGLYNVAIDRGDQIKSYNRSITVGLSYRF
ncbi:MAG: porin family protein [Bacteroidota bacterium]